MSRTLRHLVQRLLSWPVLWGVTAYVFAALLYNTSQRPVDDPDEWWVAAAGREILRTHAVPKENLYSFTDPSVPWVMHEWLLGPLYAGALSRLGLSAFNLIAVLNCAAALGLIAWGTVGRARHPISGFLAAFLAVQFFSYRFLNARPTHVALLFPLALTLLAFSPTFGWGYVAVSVVLELVWTNSHGSFPIGVVLLAGAAIGAERDRLPRAVAAALAALVTLVNPYGLGLHRLVWHYFRANEGIYQRITATIVEYGPLFREHRAGVVPSGAFFVFLLLGAAALAAATVRRHRVRALVCLFFIVMALQHTRHYAIAALITLLLLIPAADDVVDRFGLASAKPPPPSANALFGILVAPAWVLGLAAYAWTRHVRDPIDWILEGRPLFHQISALPDGAHVFLPFRESSLAIWLAADRGVRVFMDARNDCYRASTFTRFIDLTRGDVPPDEARLELARSGTDSLIVPTDHALAEDVRHDPSWQTVQTDGRWGLYRRAVTEPLDRQ